MSHHDVVVVGTGLAGLAAAVRLAEAGARVLVLAKGVGATHLGGGTIDVLGYAPERVERPAEALAAFLAARPGHPYHHVGADRIATAVAWLKDRVANGCARALRVHRLTRREPAAAHGDRRPAAVGGRARDDGRRRPARRRGGRGHRRRRLPRAQGLPRRAAG